MRLRGVGALVTGGASGLGRAAADALAAAGAKVTIFDLPSSGGSAAAGAIRGQFVGGDVTNERDVRRGAEVSGGWSREPWPKSSSGSAGSSMPAAISRSSALPRTTRWVTSGRPWTI